MREILAKWLIIQLLLTGVQYSIVHNEVYNNTYDCSEDNWMPYIETYSFIFLPLGIFVPRPEFVKDYCDKKSYEERES